MRFAPFAALAAMASAVFVMASPVPVPAAVEVRVPEAVTVRSTASVNQIITQLTSNVAGPIATLNALTASTYSSAVVVEQSNQIKTAMSSAVSQITALQGGGDLAFLFGLVGWANTLLGVTGVSLNTLAALAHVIPLLLGTTGLTARDDALAAVQAAAAQNSLLFASFLGLFNGLLSALLTPVMTAFTQQLDGNLQPLLQIIGPVTYAFYQQTSGLLFLLATDP